MRSRDKARSAQHPKTGTPKRRNAPKAARRRNSPAAATETNVAALTRERDEALEQQRATSEILRAISDAPTDAASTLGAIAESVARLLDVTDAEIIMCVEGNLLTCVTKYGPSRNWPVGTTRTLSRDWVTGRAVIDRTAIHVADLQAPECEFSQGAAFARQYGHRTTLAVPLLREGSAMGAILIRRMEVKPFTDQQIDLVSGFAAQAVIAIENTRLLKELRGRTDDLSESLEQQTATSEVLKVISRSTFDLQAVLDTLVKSAVTLCGARTGTIFLRSGDLYHLASTYRYSPEMLAYGRAHPIAPGVDSNVGRVALRSSVVHIPDVLADAEYRASEYQRIGNYRAMLGVPVMRDGKVEGVLSLARPEVGSFTHRQIELVQTFADQAVIAIENTRHFNETREALEQQTATADVLKVISRSTFDLQTVLETLVQSAARLCEAESAHIYRRFDPYYQMAVCCGFSPEYREYMESQPVLPGRETLIGRTALEGRTIHIPDVLADPDYKWREAQSLGRFRTMLGVPLLREGAPVGVLAMTRSEVRPFTDKQIELVVTFADQAVIAIENTRLLNELRESLQQQTATADVLKVISRSTFDLRTVLQTLVESAAHLCEADKATITRQKDGVFYRAESYGFSQEFMDYVRDVPVRPERGSATARALLEGVVVHIADVKADPGYTFTEAQRLGDFRTILGVPMMREETAIGVLTLTRAEVRPFSDRQIELVRTFADQAAIAIENARLFESVEARTRELAASLEDLRAAQDRLVQTEKLASLGQLTAGIAHEIKNPLNFVNNFSALSAELVGELDETLAPVALDQKTRLDVSELTSMLKGNLEKVVQHGKRADSIVKNMLLHSREGSGEHRSANINALVEESLNLAYHGARAEKSGLKIMLHTDLDPDAGAVELYPQEITRALLNLISNGFYAATKRRSDAGDETFEPVLSAATRSLGSWVEIRIRDNGTGIPPEVKEKMFNPFFTTKPTGEGTGLGLSISHDIIVKQHGGTISVKTEPGIFTEFIVTLPRTGAAPLQTGSGNDR